jgi:outer membrane lipoprotein-sorting protein
MRICLAVLSLLFVSLQQLVAVEPRNEPQEFSYTGIKTTLSEDGDVVDASTTRVSVFGQCMRTDRPDDSYYIIDPYTSRVVSINPKNKTYTVHNREQLINLRSGESKERDFQMHPAATNYYTMLTWMPDGSKQAQLDQKVVSFSRPPSIGHEITHVGPDGERATTYWIGSSNGLLVETKTTWKPQGRTKPEITIVRRDFDYDPITDKSIFTLVPPEGYEVKTATIMKGIAQAE